VRPLLRVGRLLGRRGNRRRAGRRSTSRPGLRECSSGRASTTSPLRRVPTRAHMPPRRRRRFELLPRQLDQPRPPTERCSSRRGNTWAVYELDARTGENRLATRRQAQQLRDGPGDGHGMAARPRAVLPSGAIQHLSTTGASPSVHSAVACDRGRASTPSNRRRDASSRRSFHPEPLRSEKPGQTRAGRLEKTATGSSAGGQDPHLSEFRRVGRRLLFDAHFPRAHAVLPARFAFRWSGTPAETAGVHVSARAPGGAGNRVRELERRDAAGVPWRVLSGPRRGAALAPVAQAPAQRL